MNHQRIRTGEDMFTILNPHVSDFFASPLSFILLKRRPLRKYGYIFDLSVAGGKKVDILINNAFSGLIPDKIFRNIPGFLRTLWLRIELHYWLKHNKLKDRVTVHFNSRTIANRRVLLFLCYRNYLNPGKLKETCAQFETVIGHLTHYYATPSGYSNAVKDIPNLVLACDADVTANPFFRNFFPWYKKEMIIIPFAVYERFKVLTPFEQRKPKAVATGTFHMLELDADQGHLTDLKEYAKANTVHPLRRLIYENKEKYSGEIDCYCYPYFESNVKKKKWYQKLLPKKLQVSQSSYFSFNIVDKYNEYKFVIVGEEYYNGLPGVGAFEAMACGCVLLGNRECYGGTGLVNGVHFLAHDNSMEQIIALIREGNAAPEQMKRISEAAASFVQANYAPAVLYKKFIHTVETI
ncbi:MAG TPA: glycosyltransferase [Flavisolibacter sp.]|nr:glycosyltransferase [Flavisolibacter sp.]